MKFLETTKEDLEEIFGNDLFLKECNEEALRIRRSFIPDYPEDLLPISLTVIIALKRLRDATLRLSKTSIR